MKDTRILTAQDRPAPARPAGPRRSPVVVLVDDQPEVLVSLRRVLRDEPIELASFSSAAEALEWMATHATDLIIADERMPEMRGTDLLEKVRDRFPATIRVILTGYPGSATVGYGLSHGVDWLISKPCNDDALRLTLRQLLEERGAKGAASAPAAVPAPPDFAEFCDRVPAALEWVGSDGVIRWANRADLELLGTTREELLGRPMADVHADAAALLDLLERLERGEPVRGHRVRLRRRDGREFEAMIDAAPDSESGPAGPARIVTRPLSEAPAPSDRPLEMELRRRMTDLDEINR